MQNSKAKITGLGIYAPEKRLTNSDLEKMVDTNDEWIVQRTGIKERRITREDEFTSDMCYEAILDLMKRYDKKVDDVDFILACTLTPDFRTPSVSSYLQAKFDMKNTGAIDLNAACAGFAYGLHIANGLVSSGLHKKVLVIGAETLSKIVDFTDRATCVLFGDGAGAALVEYDEENPSFISSTVGSAGEIGHHLYCSNMSTTMNGATLVNNDKVVQAGAAVYKWAVKTVPKGIEKVLSGTGYTIDDIDWFIPHSANLRMIESICEKSGIPLEKTLYSLVEYGNTSSATIPLSIDIGLKQGKIKKGDLVLMYGFGGGLAHSGHLVRWGI